MKVELKVKPFQTPNFALLEMPPGRREDGPRELPSLPLSALTAETLESLCDEFRRDVFKKAGKRDPEWDRPKQAP